MSTPLEMIEGAMLRAKRADPQAFDRESRRRWPAVSAGDTATSAKRN